MIYSFVPNENTKYNIYCYDKGNRDVDLYTIHNVPSYLLDEIVELLKLTFKNCEIVAEFVLVEYQPKKE